MTTAARRPRVGVDFHVWDGIFQGSRSHLLGLYSAAIQHAPEMDFVFFLGDTLGLRASHAPFGAPNVQLVKMAHRSGLIRLGWQLPWLQWQHRIDLMHYQYRIPPLRPGPCACTVHDILFETHPQYFARRFIWQSRLSSRHAMRAARLLLTVSRFTQHELARVYGVDPQAIHITANAVDRLRFRPGADGVDVVQELGLQPQAYMLTVGRLEPRKNHRTILEAYAQLGPDAPLLVIVGQRDFQYELLLDAFGSADLRQRVRLLENVSDDQLPALMRHALLFVYPAFAEGFGMPILEAMASGVPVVTSDTTAMPEVAGGAAILVDPHSPDQLVAAMQRVIRDPALRTSMARAGLEAAARFDWDKSAAVLVSALREHFSPALT